MKTTSPGQARRRGRRAGGRAGGCLAEGARRAGGAVGGDEAQPRGPAVVCQERGHRTVLVGRRVGRADARGRPRLEDAGVVERRGVSSCPPPSGLSTSHFTPACPPSAAARMSGRGARAMFRRSVWAQRLGAAFARSFWTRAEGGGEEEGGTVDAAAVGNVSRVEHGGLGVQRAVVAAPRAGERRVREGPALHAARGPEARRVVPRRARGASERTGRVDKGPERAGRAARCAWDRRVRLVRGEGRGVSD